MRSLFLCAWEQQADGLQAQLNFSLPTARSRFPKARLAKMTPSSADVKGAFVSAAAINVLSCPTPLPFNSHLCRADNYTIWAVQMCALDGAPAHCVMTGVTPQSVADSKRGAPSAPRVGPAEQTYCCFRHCLLHLCCHLLLAAPGTEGRDAQGCTREKGISARQGRAVRVNEDSSLEE